jgi:glycosyltransferase involved in cell wall biosynthesis
VNDIFRVPCPKIQIINNPIDIHSIIDLSHEKVEHSWFSQNTPIIISVGRLTDVKGYPYLLRSFKDIADQVSCRLVILGQGEKERSLKELAQQLGIDQSVAFLGFQNNPFKYMSRSKVFVLSSLSEAFPMVILEAMTCNVPIVSSATTGSKEIINEGANGLLVPIGDEKSLTQAILKLLSNDSLSNNLAHCGTQRVGDFSADHIIKQYEKLFETLTGKKILMVF